MKCHNRWNQVTLQRESIDTAKKGRAEKGHKEGHENVPFWVLDGLGSISASALKGIGGDDGTRTRGLCRDRATTRC